MNQDNLPIAVSLDGKRDQDLELLSTAKAIASLLTPLASPQKLAQQRLLTLQVVK
jgi:Asp-tRNA(Asn)/Glu-tRNA(Gln) amidotransferase A subunit family amidase